ncbi:mechanosensitive ion channel family protein [Sediminivirga luteola]|uniref:Mechanosensitive ion channel protein MscS n=1 Tax=Sediminivirga luteola TaxID=1774748 RepID=A0A8J2TZI3_9MICO|nr:mechanosensitive ion channel family protein [Sediminivirga luteola]GGA20881.1 mechanosensitive ion channel protein MscS [Sediminivirga luteola]
MNELTKTLKQPVQDTVETVAEADWAFLLGTPLRIGIIILIALTLNLLVRVFVRRFTDHIISGGAARRSTVETRAKRTRLRQATERIIEQDSPQALQRRKQRAQTVASLLRSLASIIITVITVLMVLSELDFNLGPILASAGIAGVAIGFGAQTLVKDYLAGLFMVVEDQYGIGDVIDVGEASGTVEEVGLRITKIRDVNGTLWYVRNGEILRVGNNSQGWARAVMDVRVPYDADVETVNELVRQVGAELRADPELGEKILEEPELWGVETLDGTGMTVRLVIKTVPLEQWAVARAFRVRLKDKLDEAGIKIPLPPMPLFTGQ